MFPLPRHWARDRCRFAPASFPGRSFDRPTRYTSAWCRCCPETRRYCHCRDSVSAGISRLPPNHPGWYTYLLPRTPRSLVSLHRPISGFGSLLSAFYASCPYPRQVFGAGRADIRLVQTSRLSHRSGCSISDLLPHMRKRCLRTTGRPVPRGFLPLPSGSIPGCSISSDLPSVPARNTHTMPVGDLLWGWLCDNPSTMLPDRYHCRICAVSLVPTPAETLFHSLDRSAGVVPSCPNLFQEFSCCVKAVCTGLNRNASNVRCLHFAGSAHRTLGKRSPAPHCSTALRCYIESCSYLSNTSAV